MMGAAKTRAVSAIAVHDVLIGSRALSPCVAVVHTTPVALLTKGTPVLDLAGGDLLVVSVPASTANLGPAMDGLGMSVPLRLEATVSAEPLSDGAPGEDAPPGSDVLRSLLADVAPDLRSHYSTVSANPIPMERGLGGSGAVRLAALLAAAASRGQQPDEHDLLRTATALEGHPDNVAPSLLGGVVATTTEDDGTVSWVELGPLAGLELVLVVPEVRISTERAREVLPERVPHADARFTAGHVALLVAAIAARRYEMLAAATRDRIHQPYRVPLVPGAEEAIAAAVPAGALCSFLSGSGSTVAALAEPGGGHAVAAAMAAAFANSDIRAVGDVLPADGRGAEVTVTRDGVELWSWRWVT